MFNFGKKPEKQEFSLVPCGEYEVFIEQAEERPTKSGRPQLSIRLKIRDDVKQPCQNRILFLNIFQKTPEKLDDLDRQVGNYNYSHLYHLLDVTGILTSGNEIEDMNDICRLLIGKEIRVTVHHEIYNGKPSEKIDQLRGVHESDPDEYETAESSLNPAYSAPPAHAVPEDESLNDFQEIISDDDIPF